MANGEGCRVFLFFDLSSFPIFMNLAYYLMPYEGDQEIYYVGLIFVCRFMVFSMSKGLQEIFIFLFMG